MGPLLPSLALVPFLLGTAWLLDDVFLVWNVPVLTVCLVAAAICLVYGYQRQYARFAREDPDRLQSEKYRYDTARMQMIAAKGLPHPVPVDSFTIEEARTNPAEFEKAAAKTDDGEKMS